MGTKGEELLWTLLWASEMVFRPTFRNLTESFEEWAYRNGFQRELQRLERRPVKLGLYFPLLRGWREWDYAPGAG